MSEFTSTLEELMKVFWSNARIAAYGVGVIALSIGAFKFFLGGQRGSEDTMQLLKRVCIGILFAAGSVLIATALIKSLGSATNPNESDFNIGVTVASESISEDVWT